jgi:hypothetical protein
MTMNREKVIEARRLVETMISFGDAPVGLAAVARLLDEGLTDEDGQDEMMWLGPEPPKFGIVRPPA